MRYLPLSDIDRGHMMARIGIATIDDLFTDVPNEARLAEPVDLPYHASEIEVERTLSRLAARTTTASAVPFFVGAGAYKHHIPATVDHLVQRSEFLTSYTPYQPEITQGTLQYLFEFQTQVALLTGMEIANASMYDGSTGTAEAVQMAMRVTKRKKAVLSGALHPHYRDVVRTALAIGDDTLIEAPPSLSPAEDLASLVDKETACVVVQTPDVFGNVRDLRVIADAAHAAGALLVAVVTEVVSLGALTSPGAMGADIVVCEGQSLGNGLNFGGPYVGLFATRKSLIRQMPGRLCGETVDAAGKRGYVLTLSTREQHIRREKATSNICTNSGLCALAFTIHLTLLGETGLRRLALLNHQAAVLLAQALEDVPGVELVTPAFFNELTIRLPKNAESVAQAMAAKGVLAGVPAARLFGRTAFAERLMIVAATEMTTDQDRAAYVAALEEVLA